MVGLPVTTLARTAYDPAAICPAAKPWLVSMLLMRANSFSRDDVSMAAVTRAPEVSAGCTCRPCYGAAIAQGDLAAGCCFSIDAGLPVPTTQIPVVHRWRNVGVLDMGWENTWRPPSTTVISIAATASLRETSGGSASWPSWAGSSFA